MDTILFVKVHLYDSGKNALFRTRKCFISSSFTKRGDMQNALITSKLKYTRVIFGRLDREYHVTLYGFAASRSDDITVVVPVISSAERTNKGTFGKLQLYEYLISLCCHWDYKDSGDLIILIIFWSIVMYHINNIYLYIFWS